VDRAPVWIRPLADACVVRVEGSERAKWLLTRRSRSFVFKTSEPLKEDYHSSRCTFRLAYSSTTRHQQIVRALENIPEIQILLDRDHEQ
jgi:hypothetical protein